MLVKLTTGLLAILSILELVRFSLLKKDELLQAEIVGADFASSSVKLATYLLAIILVLSSKRAGIIFINILRTPFSYESLCAAFLYLCLSIVIFWRKNIGEKAAPKTMMKLTPGIIFINILRAAFLLEDPKSTKILL